MERSLKFALAKALILNPAATISNAINNIELARELAAEIRYYKQAKQLQEKYSLKKENFLLYA